MTIKFNKLVSKRITYRSTKFRYQISVFVLFFLLFAAILSSGLFGPKLNIELGEPSPQLIIAPYDKDIEDLTKYHEEQEKAASSIIPVYTADERQIEILAKDLSLTFMDLRRANESYKDDAQRINELRLSIPYATLPDNILLELLAISKNELEKAEQLAARVLLGIARGTDTGARSETEIPLLKDRMKEQINRSSMPDTMKVLMQSHIELKVKKPTLTVDEVETRKLKEIVSSSVKPTVHSYRANEKIVGPGEIVDERIFQVLVAYGLIEVKSPWKPTAGIAIHVLIGMCILIVFAYQFSPEIFQRWKRLVLIALSMILVLILGKAFLAINLGNSELNNLTAALIPAAWVTMTVTILLGAKIAVVVGIILGIFIGTMADPMSLGGSGALAGLFALTGGLVGIQSVAKLDRRSDLLKAGLYVAVVNIAVVSGIALILQLSPTYWLIGCLFCLANGFLAATLTMGTVPWFESGFNITSSVRLIELSNPNAPLLKELLMEAPGTYHHSVLVGNLAETAAEEVNADPVLVRVGALYHDIGKLKRPYFFIENQFSKDNPHDKIAPTLSALILISHVKDGMEMAREHKLPENIQEIIAQHHGDSITSYFYHKALEENHEVPEEAFRYDGMRPQSKEAALVLLADNVEAVVRSQRVSSPGKIEGLVRKIIKEKFDEGLLGQCDLTFRDLDKISIAFVKVLSGIFHARVEYPELPPRMKAVQEVQEQAKQAKQAKEDTPSENIKVEETVLTGKNFVNPENEGISDENTLQEDASRKRSNKITS